MNPVIEIAEKEIGVTESPKNSNKSKYGKWFGFDGVAWCGMFVSWCYDQAGKRLPSIGFKKGFAGCQTAVKYFKEKKQITKDPVEGDIVFFDWNNDGRYDHTGLFVKKIDAKTFETIEGNTAIGNDSNGGEVMRRRRPFNKAIFVHVNMILLVLGLMLSFQVSAQNRPPVANDDSTKFRSINVLSNDSDPDGDLVRLLDYTIDGVKYSIRNSSRAIPGHGNITFNSEGLVKCDSAVVITYRISDGNRGIDTAQVKFYKSKIVIKALNTGYFLPMWILETPENCVDDSTGKYHVLLNIGDITYHGAIEFDTIGTEVRPHFIAKQWYIEQKYPDENITEKIGLYASTTLSQETFQFIKSYGCRQKESGTP